MNTFDEQSQVTQAMSVTESLYEREVRQAIRDDPKQYAVDAGIIAAESDAEVRVVESGRGTWHIPLMRVNAGSALNADDLRRLQGGVNTTGSVGTGGTVSTFSTFSGCIGSAGSASTVGTAGTAGDE